MPGSRVNFIFVQRGTEGVAKATSISALLWIPIIYTMESENSVKKAMVKYLS